MDLLSPCRRWLGNERKCIEKKSPTRIFLWPLLLLQHPLSLFLPLPTGMGQKCVLIPHSSTRSTMIGFKGGAGDSGAWVSLATSPCTSALTTFISTSRPQIRSGMLAALRVHLERPRGWKCVSSIHSSFLPLHPSIHPSHPPQPHSMKGRIFFIMLLPRGV